MGSKTRTFVKAVFIFYRGLAIPAVLITLFCCAGAFLASMNQIRQHAGYDGIFMFIAPFFWIKTVTNIILIFYIDRIRANERYFYHNLGIGRSSLWGTTLVVDYLLFFLAILLTGLGVSLFFLQR